MGKNIKTRKFQTRLTIIKIHFTRKIHRIRFTQNDSEFNWDYWMYKSQSTKLLVTLLYSSLEKKHKKQSKDVKKAVEKDPKKVKRDIDWFSTLQSTPWNPLFLVPKRFLDRMDAKIQREKNRKLLIRPPKYYTIIEIL